MNQQLIAAIFTFLKLFLTKDSTIIWAVYMEIILS